jgi:hypothetical protein
MACLCSPAPARLARKMAAAQVCANWPSSCVRLRAMISAPTTPQKNLAIHFFAPFEKNFPHSLYVTILLPVKFYKGVVWYCNYAYLCIVLLKLLFLNQA